MSRDIITSENIDKFLRADEVALEGGCISSTMRIYNLIRSSNKWCVETTANSRGSKMRILVELNGTDINPYHPLGLTQNPFPQIGQAEFSAAEVRMQSLGGDPIPDTDYIRERLFGFSKEFVELCCSKFEKGKYVKFYTEWA